MHEARTRPGGRIVWTRDATANDSDKTFTVPVGKMWELLHIYVTIVSSANAGNRHLQVVISNATPAVLCASGLSPDLPESTTRTVWFQGVFYSVAALPYCIPMEAPSLLPAGYSVRVYDASAVDAAADDMTVTVYYIEYDA